MYLIAGLGNPGRKYERTKHNVGFDVINYVTDRHGIPFSCIQFQAECGKGIIAGQKVLLAEPLTYMNLSGEAVAALVNYYKLDPEEDLVVIYDDISLDPGQIRIRKKGSAGGHNGIKNIIARLGTDKFKRIRVGIGEKPDRWDLADYVLAPFTPENREKVEEAVKDAADALEMILSGDTDGAMNRYNHKAAREARE